MPRSDNDPITPAPGGPHGDEVATFDDAGPGDVGPDNAGHRVGVDGVVTRLRESVAALTEGSMSPERWVVAIGMAVALLCSILILSNLHPSLLMKNTLTTGGDMGAHVVAPHELKTQLLPHFQLNGWSDDWYAGYPLYQFYMVIPAILIVLLDVGLPLWLGIPLLAVVVGGGVYLLETLRNRLLRGLVITAMVLAIPLCVDLPENVAFKLVTVSGLVALPWTCWALARLARAPSMVQYLFPIAAMYFVFDSHFEILGGNAASTLAGEFSFALSLNLVLVALGLVIRGLETGRHRSLTAVLIGLAATTHVIPIFYLVAGAAVALALRPGLKRLWWLAQVFAVGGAISAFWLGAFYLHSDYLNDMGWEKTVTYAAILFPHNLPYREVVIGLALIGAVSSFAVPRRIGMLLTGCLVGAALLVRYIQQPPMMRFWNERVLPFWFLCLAMLAAVGAAYLISALAGSLAPSESGHRFGRPALATMVGGGILLAAFWATGPRHWPWSVTIAVILAAAAVITILALVPDFDARRSATPVLGVVAALVAIGAIWLPTRPVHWKKEIVAANGVRTEKQILGQDVQVPSPSFRKDATTTMLDGYRVGPWVVSSARNVFSDWATWNYGGYEDKESYPEFRNLMTTMGRIGREHGCGRAMWEYFEGLGRYGTPMAPMLLPLYTDGCIGSMEGLYFEASMTTPFHFLNQAELSEKPSSPKRNMPYDTLNVAKGVEHLQLYGVKYYMAKSAKAQAQAAKVPDLVELARVPSGVTIANDGADANKESPAPWVIYEVKNAEVVEPLDHLPAVMTDVGQGHDEWLDPSVAWYQDPTAWSVFLAADGPAKWPRVRCGVPPTLDAAHPRNWGVPCREKPKAVPVTPAKVSKLVKENERISFDVDRTGSPVLVKVSYFPRWKVSGAEGPFRVAPNLMVVVPTAKHVELTYGSTWVEYVTWGITLAGLAVACLWAWRREPRVATAGHLPGDDRPPTPPGAAEDVDPDATVPPSDEMDPGRFNDWEVQDR